MPSFIKKHPLALILTATALLYLPVLRYQFAYDDNFQIVRNPRIFTWNFASYFLHHVWVQQARQGGYYRPLFLVWIRLNYALLGINASAWHVSTLLLHLIAVGLVYLLLSKTITDRFVLIVATAIFALHPAHVESVAWISGLTDPLLAIPVIGCLLCWIQFHRTHSKPWLITSLLLMFAALLTKETAVVLPALVLAYSFVLSDFPDQKSRWKEAVRDSVPFLVTLFIYSLLRWSILHNEQNAPLHSAGEVIASIPSATGFYLHRVFWPLRQSEFYDYRPAAFRAPLALLACAVILAIVAVGVFVARRSRSYSLAWAWIVLLLAPTIAGIAYFSKYDCVHDRYLYLPLIGFAVLFADALSRLRIGPPVFGLPALQLVTTFALLGFFTFALLAQLPAWQNDYTLYRRSIIVAPLNPMPYQRMGASLANSGNLAKALPFFQKAIQLDPNDFIANLSLAEISYEFNNFDDALVYCDRANQQQPRATNTCYMIESTTLRVLKRFPAAEAPVRIAISYWPRQPGQHLLLGQIMQDEGNMAGAKQQFEFELTIDPGSVDAKNALANLNSVL